MPWGVTKRGIDVLMEIDMPGHTTIIGATYPEYAAVEEAFWVDITLHNPLNTEVLLANPTVIVKSSSGDTSWIRDNIVIKTTADTTLYANELHTLSISIRTIDHLCLLKGSRDIGEVWVVPGPEDQIWVEPLDSAGFSYEHGTENMAV
ncbi:hypothetical protein EDB19DRAFT_1902254 [Suillus lakei]|nr:hypothetical protein EDB19DRAFT_1902254 [Suillus lakei]